MPNSLLKIVFFCLAFLVPGIALAQTGTIEGRVLDPEGVSLPGASVVLEGTTYGTATDVDGQFSFKAPAGEYTLLVSFVGYGDHRAPVVISANETIEINVQLEEGAINLDEVVVTALGVQREERSLGYSFQEVKPDVIQNSNETNMVNALAGKVAGMQVTSSSGQPGKAARITLRGNSSIMGNNQPLFVIDGVPISNDEDDNLEGESVFTGGTSNRAVDIDPSIIEDITVLKGASAMALYGSRAANGAVIITTKGGRGTQGVRVTFNSSMRWDDTNLSGFQNAYTLGTEGCFESGVDRQHGGYMDDECWAPLLGMTPEEVKTRGNPQGVSSWGPHIDSLNANTALLQRMGVDRVEAYDPREAFYQTGAVLENSIGIAGSALGGNYFLSFGDLRQEGVVPGSNFDRTSLMAKFGGDLTKKLDVETSINYVRSDNAWMNEGNGMTSYLFSLNFAPINFDVTDYQWEDESQRVFHSAFNNPLWLVRRNQYSSDLNRFIGSLSVGYDILPGLTLRERAGIDTYTDKRKGGVDIGTASRPEGSMYDQTINRQELNSDLILSADRRSFGKIGLGGLLGYNVNYRYFTYDYLRGEVLGLPGFFHISNASTVTGDEYLEERMIHGLYSQVTMDYNDWVYLTLTGRNDWSSTLPANNNSYFYPSVSLGLVFTEAFNVFNNSPLGYGKLRASWARIGNDADPYVTNTYFIKAAPSDGQRGEITFPFNGNNGYERGDILGNPNLKPELSSEYEFGVDLRFFSQRVRLDAAYYNRSTVNQIFNVDVSAATGYAQRWINAGEVKNVGYEVMLGLTPIETRDLQWDITANWSKNNTEIVELAPGVEDIFLAGFTDAQIRAQKGKDGYGVIWSQSLLRANREDHAALFEKYPDLEEGTLLINSETGLPLIGPNDIIGHVQPDWLGNIRTSLTYKGLTASVLADVRQGGDVFNQDLYYTTYYGTAGVTEARGTEIVHDGFAVTLDEQGNIVDGVGINTKPVLRDQSYFQDWYSEARENFVEDGSYIKLRELGLSYTLPQQLTRRFGVEGLTLSAVGRNLWIRSDFSYGDPEGSVVGAGNGQGFYHMVTPNTKSYSFGVRVTI